MAYNPIDSLYLRSKAMINHPDESISSRLANYGESMIRCRAELVIDKSGSRFLACRMIENGKNVLVPTKYYNGRTNGLYPHLINDKASYVIGGLYGQDSNGYRIYKQNLLDFWEWCKTKPKHIQPYIKLITSEVNYRDVLSMLIAAIDSTSLSTYYKEFCKTGVPDKKLLEGVNNINICFVYENGKPVWDRTDPVLTGLWGDYIETKVVSELGKPRTNVCNGKLEIPAKKINAISYRGRSGRLIPKETLVDAVRGDIGDRYISQSMSVLQDIIANNSSELYTTYTTQKKENSTVLMLAYSDTMNPIDIQTESIIKKSMAYYDYDLDKNDDINVDTPQSSVNDSALTLESSLVSPYLSAINKYAKSFPKLGKTTNHLVNIMYLHIPSKGQAAMLGFTPVTNVHQNIVSYAEDTIADCIMFTESVDKKGKKTFTRTIGKRVPTITNICSACSSHHQRVNRDVKSYRIYSHGIMMSLVNSVIANEPIPMWVLNKAANNIIKDLGVYGQCNDILTQLSTLDSIFNNISRRTQMGNDTLQSSSEKIGQMVAIAASIAQHERVIGNDNAVFAMINKIIAKPADVIFDYFTMHVVGIYIKKFARVYSSIAEQYKNEINVLMSELNREDLNQPLDKASFAIGFHRKTVIIEREKMERIKKAKEKKLTEK